MRLALVFQLAARPIMRRARRSRPTDAGGSMPSGTPDPPRVRYIILLILANIRPAAGFRLHDVWRRRNEYQIRHSAVSTSQYGWRLGTALRRMSIRFFAAEDLAI